jgi:transcriptional regulator with XRE-family HTH domain
MSQLDLANETGVGMRTIGRIEKGEGENSPSIETLEAYFGIGDSSVATDQGSPPDTPPTIEQYTLMELLAEAVRRVAQMEARTGERATDTGRRVKWSTSDAPSSRRPEGPGQPGHGVHGVQ